MLKTVKITKRDRYTQIINILNTVEADAELVAFCEGEIALLDKKSAKAKETAAAKKTEVDELTMAIQNALTDEHTTIADITEIVAGDDESITTAKVSYRLSQLVKSGIAESTDIKIAGGEGVKARTVKGYRIASIEA